MRYLLPLGILAYLYGCYVGGYRFAHSRQPEPLPTPRVHLHEPEAPVNTLEYRLPMPTQHSAEPLRVQL